LKQATETAEREERGRLCVGLPHSIRGVMEPRFAAQRFALRIALFALRRGDGRCTQLLGTVHRRCGRCGRAGGGGGRREHDFHDVGAAGVWAAQQTAAGVRDQRLQLLLGPQSEVGGGQHRSARRCGGAVGRWGGGAVVRWCGVQNRA
jgi:hypothetical protein